MQPIIVNDIVRGLYPLHKHSIVKIDPPGKCSRHLNPDNHLCRALIVAKEKRGFHETERLHYVSHSVEELTSKLSRGESPC